ncbi:MAG: hypothetical protein QXP80_01900 [Zestosphaera sp.]
MLGQEIQLWLALLREASSNRCLNSETSVDYASKVDLSGLEATYVSVDGRQCFKSLLPLAFKAIEAGADIYDVSNLLDWRDFEELVLEYLRLSGLEGVRGLRSRVRRYEYDVVAVSPISGIGLIIDCKHWSPSHSKRGRLKQAANKHRLKCEHLVNICESFKENHKLIARVKWFIPVLVTLSDVLRGSIEGVLVVPVRAFRDFIVNLEYYVDLMREPRLKLRNKCWGSS